MTLIHMAPQVPLPDRLYDGRVQLLEVKYTLVLLFDLHCKTTQQGFSKSNTFEVMRGILASYEFVEMKSQFLHRHSLSQSSVEFYLRLGLMENDIAQKHFNSICF